MLLWVITARGVGANAVATFAHAALAKYFMPQPNNYGTGLGVCPHCGHCPTCGRSSGYPGGPWVIPQQPGVTYYNEGDNKHLCMVREDNIAG